MIRDDGKLRQLLADWQQRGEVALLPGQRETLLYLIKRMMEASAVVETCRVGLWIDQAAGVASPPTLFPCCRKALRAMADAVRADAGARVDKLDLNAETP